MTWDGEIEHGALLHSARTVIADLAGLGENLRHGDVQHIVHSDFARRAGELSALLDSALLLATHDEYAPSFALMRVALEHHLIDRLVMLGRRYVQRFRGVEDDTWTEWQAARERGDDGFTDITDWRRSSRGQVTIYRQGLKSEGTGEMLGIHYFLLSEFSPFLGKPGVLPTTGIGEREEIRRAQASRNRDLYEVYLRWASIKDSLLANAMMTETDLNRLDVHYRFLSAFVHPLSNVTDLLYGRNARGHGYDHFSSELLLLYVNVVAARALGDFTQMASSPPTVTIEGSDTIAKNGDDAQRLAAHLWFLDQEPTDFDRWTTANQIAFEQYEGTKAIGVVTDPLTLPPADVRYYDNPLARMVALHRSTHEMITGLAYQSPWPREDAGWR